MRFGLPAMAVLLVACSGGGDSYGGDDGGGAPAAPPLLVATFESIQTNVTAAPALTRLELRECR
jgi:hypothetical protein